MDKLDNIIYENINKFLTVDSLNEDYDWGGMFNNFLDVYKNYQKRKDSHKSASELEKKEPPIRANTTLAKLALAMSPNLRKKINDRREAESVEKAQKDMRANMAQYENRMKELQNATNVYLNEANFINNLNAILSKYLNEQYSKTVCLNLQAMLGKIKNKQVINNKYILVNKRNFLISVHRQILACYRDLSQKLNVQMANITDENQKAQLGDRLNAYNKQSKNVIAYIDNELVKYIYLEKEIQNLFRK